MRPVRELRQCQAAGSVGPTGSDWSRPLGSDTLFQLPSDSISASWCDL